MMSLVNVINSGGGLVNQIKKSYSLSDLTDRHTREEGIDETDVMITDTRLMRKRQSPRRGPTPPMYFSEIDVRTDAIVSVQSVEDISSSGYSSGEGLTNQSLKLQAREGLVRSGSIGSSKARPTRLTRSTVVPKKSSTTDDDSEAVTDGPEPDVIFFNDRIESIDNLPAVARSEPSEKSESSSDSEYVDTVESKSELEELKQTGKSNNIIEQATENVAFIQNVHEIKPETDIVALPEIEAEPINFETKAELTETASKSSDFSEEIRDASSKEMVAFSEEVSVVEPEVKTTIVLDEKIGSPEEILSASTNDEPDTEILTFYDVPETPEIKSNDIRGGKYNKKSAPEPPTAITATLVLKPGVVKTLDDNVEIFCNSPKTNRRSLSRSRSPSPSRKPKKASPMTRIMLLPKKMGGFLKHGSLIELRSTSEETLAAARSTASLTSVPEENKKSIKQFFQRRKHE